MGDSLDLDSKFSVTGLYPNDDDFGVSSVKICGVGDGEDEASSEIFEFWNDITKDYPTSLNYNVLYRLSKRYVKYLCIKIKTLVLFLVVSNFYNCINIKGKNAKNIKMD